MVSLQGFWTLVVTSEITESDIEDCLNKIGKGWAELDFKDAGGAMEIAGLAIHCTCSSPELDVHIKVYLPAQKAGLQAYKRMGSQKRIKRLYERLKELQREDLQIAPIHGLYHSDGGLIVIMEQVQIVEQLFATHDQKTLQSMLPSALRDLDTKQKWLHFDVCPKNVGVNAAGKFCYLDLESLYKIGEEGSNVSEPMTKAVRISADLCETLRTQLKSEQGVTKLLAIRFHNHQLARLAIDIFAGTELIGADIDNLVTDSRVSTPSNFWEEKFAKLVRAGKAPNPQKLASELERISA